MRHVTVIVLALLAAACSKQQAVKSGLVEAGIASPVADCMSTEMSKRLSVAQLQKLARADTGDGKTLAQLTIAEVIERARRIGDPEVVVVTGLAAARCSQPG
jgi:predicted TIM-barrel enzyme